MTTNKPESFETTEPTEKIPSERGWGWPWNSRKAHYFLDNISLCRGWMYCGKREDNNHDSPDNCVKCRKQLAKMNSKPT